MLSFVCLMMFVRAFCREKRTFSMDFRLSCLIIAALIMRFRRILLFMLNIEQSVAESES
jgi:lysylphosphatidylglycerol synthetase-like protein (DUF2156 family)